MAVIKTFVNPMYWFRKAWNRPTMYENSYNNQLKLFYQKVVQDYTQYVILFFWKLLDTKFWLFVCIFD